MAPAMMPLGRMLSLALMVTIASCVASTAAAATTRITYTLESSPSSVWVMNGDGSSCEELGLGDHPVISPSGAVVAAAAVSEEGDPLGQVVLYSTTGAEPVEVTLDAPSATVLAFSPDSRYVAVSLADGIAGRGLAVIDVETASVTYVIGGTIGGASFNPQGADELVFGRHASATPKSASPVDLYTWAPNGMPPKQLTSDGRSTSPVWGPGYIAYDHQQLDHFDVDGNKLAAMQTQIWLRYPNGSTRRLTHMRLGYLQSGLVPIAASASGTHLAAELEEQDIPRAYAIDVPSGSGHPLLDVAISFAGGISTDGNRVLVGHFEYGGTHNQILSVPFGGGHPTVLLQQRLVLEPTWSE
jgi:hypothetical protein